MICMLIVSFYYLILVLLAFDILLQHNCNSYYLDYLFSLNYWNSNTLALLIICSFIAPIKYRIFLIFIWCVLFKFQILEDICVKKFLITSLHIGTVIIHPFLFYFSLLYLSIKNFQMKGSYFVNSLILLYSVIQFLLAITLALGGFWGFQSTIWGYFWVNDTIEWLLLFNITYILFRLHSLRYFTSIQCPSLFFLIIINMIIVVRLNLLPTRHSFIIAPNTILYIICIYTVSLFILCQSNLKLKIDVKLVSIMFFLFLISNLLWFWKLFLLNLMTFFISKITSKLILNTLVLHFFIFLFFLIWNIYFPFFFIYYTYKNILNLSLSIFINNLHLSPEVFYAKQRIFSLLESVVINFGQSERFINLKFTLIAGVKLNVKLILLWVVCYFFFL